MTSDDVIQKAIMKAWLHLNDFDPAKGDFSRWFYKILLNCQRDAYRERDEEEFVESVFTAHEPTYTFAHTRLREAAGDNFFICEDILFGYSLDEIAQRHNLTKPAVQQRLKRIAQKQKKNHVQ
jgi:DNA-directed RNA polymerase specialized sigma24 family protein